MSEEEKKTGVPSGEAEDNIKEEKPDLLVMLQNLVFIQVKISEHLEMQERSQQIMRILQSRSRRPLTLSLTNGLRAVRGSKTCFFSAAAREIPLKIILTAKPISG